MIVLDANLLIYAYDTASPHHKAAIGWMGKVRFRVAMNWWGFHGKRWPF